MTLESSHEPIEGHKSAHSYYLNKSGHPWMAAFNSALGLVNTVASTRTYKCHSCGAKQTVNKTIDQIRDFFD